MTSNRFGSLGLPQHVQSQLERLCREFAAEWKAGRGPSVHGYSDRVEAAHRELLRQKLEELEAQLGLTTLPEGQPDTDGAGLGGEETGRVESTPTDQATPMPERLGRYSVQRSLGQGAFGHVLLAEDTELQRLVALKVPSPRRFDAGGSVSAFLDEARSAARLKHPLLVAVYDVQVEDGRPFIVQEYVEGLNLKRWRENRELDHRQIVELLLQIATALGYAHSQGLIHRDLKPANILIDRQDKPHIADFGLAMHESLRHRNLGQVTGTPAYMSPEQVGGETHRLDGRTDLWGLGVIFYELLTGRRPFGGDTQTELFSSIQTVDPLPPRQLDSSIPGEVQRICLKCLEKRAADRYETADDLMRDLHDWLDSTTPEREPSPKRGSDHLTIAPKGLRSFDEGDADFFLELLPGPRDRNGLPQSISAWKERIEEPDRDKGFSVGLLYGPSGCGKSSLVKAGLLPRLHDRVATVYVEATPDKTEDRLWQGLKNLVPHLSETTELPEVVAALRETRNGGRSKVLIVLDQFEQWLHSHDLDRDRLLVSALRQCDGVNVQCLLLVRDDFWMSITRFMDALEVPLIQGRNSAAVNLFELDHGRKVLAAFGRAYGKLPQEELTGEQAAFVDRAVEGLSEDGKIITVRLAVFAQMMQNRVWTPESLHEVGGTEGVGVRFLEETFSARAAPPQYRLHEKGVRAVLEALLPEAGTDIKGRLRTREELIEAAEYQDRPAEFDALLSILDGEVRLITPTEADDPAAGPETHPEDHASTTVGYYQLTHDYLVPSLREWLTRKRKETRQGRTELRLAERAELWKRKPENRHLPTVFEVAAIRLRTRPNRWNESERRMMKRASRFWAVRLTLGAAVIAMLVTGGLVTRDRILAHQARVSQENLEQQFADRARGLVDALIVADVGEVQEVIEEIEPYMHGCVPLLHELVVAEPNSLTERRQHLHARIVLVAEDDSQVEPLLSELLNPRFTDPRYVEVISDSLKLYRDRLLPQLWQRLRDSTAPESERFRAGLALARYAHDADDWTEHDDRFLVGQLISSDAESQPEFRSYLRARKEPLLPHLVTAFSEGGAADQVAAAKGIVDYAGDRSELIARLLVTATPEQYAILYPRLDRVDENVRQRWLDLVRQQPAEDLPPPDRVPLGQRRAGAAIALLRQGERESIFDVFRVSEDPESLTQFVHGCRTRGVRPEELLDCLDRADAARTEFAGTRRKAEDRVVYGLLLALGEFSLDELPQDRQASFIERLNTWHASDPSSGIHSATGWLLRQWGRDDLARAVDRTPVPYDPDREWYTIEVQIAGPEPPDNSIYFTFIVFPPGEYRLGSPDNEPNHEWDEDQYRVTLTRPVAVLDREVTWEQFDPMGTFHRRQWERTDEREFDDQEAAFAVNWYESVDYCRWLTAQMGLPAQEQCYADPATVPRDDEGNPLNWPFDYTRRGIRLLTDAEWEAVCRQGTRSAYSFGNDEDMLVHYGWFQSNSDEWLPPVGRLRPNLGGLFDCHGSLREWCHDWYERDKEGHTVDPTGPENGLYRQVRGGSWVLPPQHCRSATRDAGQPLGRGGAVGFRIACFPSQQTGEPEPTGEPTEGDGADEQR